MEKRLGEGGAVMHLPPGEVVEIKLSGSLNFASYEINGLPYQANVTTAGIFNDDHRKRYLVGDDRTFIFRFGGPVDEKVDVRFRSVDWLPVFGWLVMVLAGLGFFLFQKHPEQPDRSRLAVLIDEGRLVFASTDAELTREEQRMTLEERRTKLLDEKKKRRKKPESKPRPPPKPQKTDGELRAEHEAEISQLIERETRRGTSEDVIQRKVGQRERVFDARMRKRRL